MNNKLDTMPFWCSYGNYYTDIRECAHTHGPHSFSPRPEFEQDASKYPHMQGVADTVKEGNE